MNGAGGTAAQTEDVTVTGLAAGGAAIGRLAGGQVVFVEGALPGEVVRVEITHRRKDFARGEAAEVIAGSADRIAPPCPHVGRGCGGCGWQHVDPQAAPRLKAGIALDALARIGQVRHDIEVLPPLAAPADGYRTTARFAVLGDGTLGYRRHRSEEIVGVGPCPVVHPRLDQLLRAIRVHGAAQVTLRVGVAGGERLAVLPGPGLRPAGRSAGSRPGARGGGPPTPDPDAAGGSPKMGAPRAQVEVPEGVRVVRGPGGGACIHESVGGRTWRVSAYSFFQSGPAAAELLVSAVDAAVGDALGPGGVLVDAYAGVGLLGGVVAARRGARLVAVEASRPAAADARANLADLGACVVHQEVGRWAACRADVVVADPARPGLGRPGVATVAAAGAPRLVLVSCDPASLGRDARLLAAEGYRPSALQVADLFPRTPHVETVVRFERT